MKNNGTLIFAGIVVLAFIAYQAFVAVPNNKIKAQEAQFLFNKTMLEQCKQEAIDNYNAQWNKECLVTGVDKRSEGCRLPAYYADDLTAQANKVIDRCVEAYK